jgi:hypothetical protein
MKETRVFDDLNANDDGDDDDDDDDGWRATETVESGV